MSKLDFMTPEFVPGTANANEVVEIQARINSIALLNRDIVEIALVLEQPLTNQAKQASRFCAAFETPPTGEQEDQAFVRDDSAANVNTMQFHVRKVPGGAFNEWLFGGNRKGAKVTLQGPYGSFARIRPHTAYGHNQKAATELALCVHTSVLSPA